MVRHPPANNQRSIALFLSLGHHDSLIRRLKQAYMERWEIMGEALEKYMPKSLEMPAFGGSAFWIKGPETLDTIELRETAKGQGILIETGDVYFSQEHPPRNFFRLGYSSIPKERIDQGILELSELIKKQLDSAKYPDIY